MSKEEDKQDKAYKEYLEKVMKVEHPYEYALLTSDLKENLKKMPMIKETEVCPTYHISSKYVKNHLKYWR